MPVVGSTIGVSVAFAAADSKKAVQIAVIAASNALNLAAGEASVAGVDPADCVLVTALRKALSIVQDAERAVLDAHKFVLRNPFNGLPDEMLCHVFNNCDGAMLMACARVCQRWRRIILPKVNKAGSACRPEYAARWLSMLYERYPSKLSFPHIDTRMGRPGERIRDAAVFDDRRLMLTTLVRGLPLMMRSMNFSTVNVSGHTGSNPMYLGKNVLTMYDHTRRSLQTPTGTVSIGEGFGHVTSILASDTHLVVRGIPTAGTPERVMILTHATHEVVTRELGDIPNTVARAEVMPNNATRLEVMCNTLYVLPVGSSDKPDVSRVYAIDLNNPHAAATPCSPEFPCAGLPKMAVAKPDTLVVGSSAGQLARVDAHSRSVTEWPRFHDGVDVLKAAGDRAAVSIDAQLYVLSVRNGHILMKIDFAAYPLRFSKGLYVRKHDEFNDPFVNLLTMTNDNVYVSVNNTVACYHISAKACSEVNVHDAVDFSSGGLHADGYCAPF